MATLTLSSPAPYEGGTAVSSALFGYASSKNRVVRYTFKTGSSGATSFKLSGNITKYDGSYDVSSIYCLRFKITTDSTSHKNADKSSSYDGEITSTSVDVTVNQRLNPNTTYYLWLFPGHSSYSVYYAYNPNNNNSPTLSIVTYLDSYKLTTNAGSGSTITVNRSSSPIGGASAGNISSGATLYPDDVLKISFTASAGYELVTHTVNNSSFQSGNTVTVSGNVSVATTTKMLGLVYIDEGGSFGKYLIYIDNGTGWDMYIPYIDNGSSWDLCS
jgi:hypothetical protein